MPALVAAICVSGDWIKFAAATTAASHSFWSSAMHARCRPYIEEAQAVSSVNDGPLRSKQCDSRLDKMEMPAPTAVNLVKASLSR